MRTKRSPETQTRATLLLATEPPADRPEATPHGKPPPWEAVPGAAPAGGRPPPGERPPAHARLAKPGLVAPDPAEPDPGQRDPVGLGDARAADPELVDAGPAQRGLTARQRLRLAIAERFPGGWARRRCGVEPRTVLAICGVLLTVLAFAAHHYWGGRPQPVLTGSRSPASGTADATTAPEPATDAVNETGTAGQPASPTAPGPAGATSQEDGALVIDVAGDVATPGVITLPPGARVADAIEAAGGVTPGAETDQLNRARLLSDGEHLVVGPDAPVAPAPQSGGAPAGPEPGQQLSINSASAQELEQLPGVGPVLAGNIVRHREQHGSFSTVEELLAVSGIGETRLADLRDRVLL